MTAPVALAQVREFNVQEQAAQSGIQDLGRQAGLQILANQKDLEGQRIRAVRGTMDVRAALVQALAGTGLEVASDDGQTIVLRAKPATAPAKPAAAKPPAAKASDAGLYLDEIVVTGVATGTSKFETSYAISTLSEEEIQREAPQSTADLIGRLPGFYSEASGGESNNNISPRGLPGSFGTKFIAIVEDGMPFFQDPNEIYLNGDSFLRNDIMTERVEAVRSGPAPVFTSNAPAGVINTITRKGGDTPEGAVRVTWQDTGMKRLDGYWSGPLGSDWYLAAGGFWRTHDGYRDPGFPADQGGQFRANLTKRFEGGEFTAYAKVIDEKNIFYLPVPLKDPRDMSSVSDLIDPLTGTLIANENRHYVVKSFIGDQTISYDRDLADGRRAKAKMAGFEFNKEFGDGWLVSNKLRWFDATVDLDTLFTTTAPQDYQTYLAGKLAGARKAFGNGVQGLKLVLADERGSGGARVAWDPATTRGLVMESSYRYVPTSGDTISDDLQITKSVSGVGPGTHEITVGGYFSSARLEHARLLQDALIEMKEGARRLDIIAVDAAGNQVGSLSEDGFFRYGSYFISGKAESEQYALYLADSWKVTPELTIDAGYRKQWYDQTGVRHVTETRNLGDPATMADDSFQGNSGRSSTFTMNRTNQAWTVGANYEFTPRFASFVRYTNAFRGQNLWASVTNTTTPDDKIRGAEVGIKFNTRPFSLFSTFFWTDFDRLSVAGPTVNPRTGANESSTYWGKTEVYGIETEAMWKPVSFFRLSGNFTYQQPRQRDLQESKYGALGEAYDGKLPSRVPEYLARITPTVYFDAGPFPTSVFARVSYTGKRYVDALNATKLPSYTTLDMGVRMDLRDDFTLQLTGSNLTNEIGLTEGNPRVDSLDGQGTDEAIFGRPIFGRNFRLVATYSF